MEGAGVDIPGEHVVESVYRAAQFISSYHPADYIRHLARAYEREQSPSARAAWRPMAGVRSVRTRA